MFWRGLYTSLNTENPKKCGNYEWTWYGPCCPTCKLHGVLNNAGALFFACWSQIGLGKERVKSPVAAALQTITWLQWTLLQRTTWEARGCATRLWVGFRWLLIHALLKRVNVVMESFLQWQPWGNWISPFSNLTSQMPCDHVACHFASDTQNNSSVPCRQQVDFWLVAAMPWRNPFACVARQQRTLIHEGFWAGC